MLLFVPIVGHKASKICFHLARLFVVCCISSHVVLGRPCFLLPGGVLIMAVFAIRSWSILRTCPSHRLWRRLISGTTLWIFVLLYSSSLMIFIGQVYTTYPPEASIVKGTDLVHVALSNSPALWAIQQDFVVVLYWLDFQTVFSLANAPVAFPSLGCISFCAALSFLMRLPRYGKLLTYSSGSLLTVIVALGMEYMHITLAFDGLMFRPTCMAKLFSLSVNEVSNIHKKKHGFFWHFHANK